MFNKMPSRDVVTWNAMVLGPVKCDQGQKTLELFRQMQQEGVQPDSVTFVAVLNARASVVALEEGRYVHQQIVQTVVSLRSLCGVAWLTCMRSVGAWRMLGVCSTSCHLKMW